MDEGYYRVVCNKCLSINTNILEVRVRDVHFPAMLLRKEKGEEKIAVICYVMVPTSAVSPGASTRYRRR